MNALSSVSVLGVSVGVELDQRVDGGAQGRGGCKQKKYGHSFLCQVLGVSVGVELDQQVDGGAQGRAGCKQR